MPASTKNTPLQIDGSTLNGGGQVLRNAITLSALTSRAVTINSIRANRPDGAGLKTAHLPAIQSLAQVSNSVVKGADLGSTSLTFYPPESIDGKAVNMKYRAIETPGSLSLVFQTLYPYLLLSGGLAEGKVKGPIQVDFKGCTNISGSPTFEYIEQVLAPNMKVLGFPELNLELVEREWMTGLGEQGSVKCWIHPLPSTTGPYGKVKCHFPLLNLDRYNRGKVIKIDITVLAPDNKVSWLISGTGKKKDNLTIRKFIEQETIAKLRKELKGIPSKFIKPNVPIEIHASEQTYHLSHVNVLIVAHTTTSFRLGRDGILGGNCFYFTDGTEQDENIRNLIRTCTKKFALELYDRHKEETWLQNGTHRACVDRSMRNQLVIFEELGRLSASQNCYSCNYGWEGRATVEDSRYWSGHTRSAQWVCQNIVGSIGPA